MPEDNKLADAVAMIKKAMRYVSGSASISFRLDQAGVVTQFRLLNNFDEQADAGPVTLCRCGVEGCGGGHEAP